MDTDWSGVRCIDLFGQADQKRITKAVGACPRRRPTMLPPDNTGPVLEDRAVAEALMCGASKNS